MCAQNFQKNSHSLLFTFLIDKVQKVIFDLFYQIASEKGLRENLRLQKGYDHSYYFIASFMEDHIRHHAQVLCK